MKNITKKSIEEDYKIISDMFNKYSDAVWENQEAQKAHYDNQSKLVRLAMGDVKTGLFLVSSALTMLIHNEIIEDERI